MRIHGANRVLGKNQEEKRWKTYLGRARGENREKVAGVRETENESLNEQGGASLE